MHNFDYTGAMALLIKDGRPRGKDYSQQAKELLNDIIDPKTKNFFEQRNSKKPLKRRKSQGEDNVDEDSQQNILRQRLDKYTDSEIKRNWTTIMPFCAFKWEAKKQKPWVVEHISKQNKSVHYVGRSDIGEDQEYFLVSENIIPNEPPYYVFTKSWLDKLPINVETEITPASKKRLDGVVDLFEEKAITHLYPQAVVNGKKGWWGKQTNGHIDKTITQEWIDENLKDQFPLYYEDIHEQSSIGKKIEMPVGKVAINFSLSDENEEDTIPSELLTKTKVNFCFENKNSCAFGNMANAADALRDKKTAYFFYAHRQKNPNDMRERYTKIDHRVNINQFHLAREILRQKFKYGVVKIHGTDLVEIANQHRNEVLYVCLQHSGSSIPHALCITDNKIVDGTFAHRLKCNRECLVWLCDGNSFTFLAYSLHRKPKVKKAVTTKK